jgi:hypothetical protein
LQASELAQKTDPKHTQVVAARRAMLAGIGTKQNNGTIAFRQMSQEDLKGAHARTYRTQAAVVSQPGGGHGTQAMNTEPNSAANDPRSDRIGRRG